MRVLTIFLFFISIGYAQVNVGGWTTSKYRANNTTELQRNGFSYKETFLNKAIQTKLEYPDSIVGVHWIETLTLDLADFTKIDTLQIYGSWHLTGPNGNYFRFPDCGDIFKIEADTIIKWQKDIEVIRTKKFGKTAFKLTDSMPFQFVSDTITKVTSATELAWQTFATEKHCIKTYVDNIYTGDQDISCTPGQVFWQGQTLWRHSNSIDSLQPSTNYKIRVEGTTENGIFNIIEFDMRTID